MRYFLRKSMRGFTLIELLIVIAILGVLAGAILVAINPTEQLARGRDAGKTSTVTELGKGIAAYYTTQNGTYPGEGVGWIGILQDDGEIKTIPTAQGPQCSNAAFSQNGYCYQTDSVEAIVYAPAESKSLKTRGTCAAAEQAWVVWSSADAKTGIACTTNTATYPSVGITNLK